MKSEVRSENLQQLFLKITSIQNHDFKNLHDRLRALNLDPKVIKAVRHPVSKVIPQIPLDRLLAGEVFRSRVNFAESNSVDVAMEGGKVGQDDMKVEWLPTHRIRSRRVNLNHRYRGGRG